MNDMDKNFRIAYKEMCDKYSADMQAIQEEMNQLSIKLTERKNQYLQDLQTLKDEHTAKGGHF